MVSKSSSDARRPLARPGQEMAYASGCLFFSASTQMELGSRSSLKNQGGFDCKGEDFKRWANASKEFVALARACLSEMKQSTGCTKLWDDAVKQCEDMAGTMESSIKRLEDMNQEFDEQLLMRKRQLNREMEVAKRLLGHKFADAPPYAGLQGCGDDPDERESEMAVEYAMLYYKHASAARYTADELINLGPAPSDEVNGSMGLHEQDEIPSNALTRHEYLERHKQLLEELAYARTEGDEARRLCRKHNVTLDHDPVPYEQETDDDLYRTALQDLEFSRPPSLRFGNDEIAEPRLRTLPWRCQRALRSKGMHDVRVFASDPLDSDSRDLEACKAQADSTVSSALSLPNCDKALPYISCWRRLRISKFVPRLLLLCFLPPTASAQGLGRTFGNACGATAGVGSIWKANITPTKEEAFVILYHGVQVVTIMSLIAYAGYSTLRRNGSHHQSFVLCSLFCGVSFAALCPGRRFEACLEAFIALGFFSMGFVFDNVADWSRGLWAFMDRLRPGHPAAILPVHEIAIDAAFPAHHAAHGA